MSVDFQRLRESLSHARQRLSRQRSRDEITAILGERSRALAARSAVQEEHEHLAQLVVVRRGNTTFGVPIEAVRELRWATVTVIPRATEVVIGLFQVRGQSYCLIDVAPFFGDAAAAEQGKLQHGDRSLVMLVIGPAGALGLRVDEVLGPRAVARHEIDTDLHGGVVEFVSHVLHDKTCVLDVETLYAQPAIRVKRPRQ